MCRVLICAALLTGSILHGQPSADVERIARLESRLDAMVKATQEAEERRAEWERWLLGMLATGVATGAGALFRWILTEPRRRRALQELVSTGDAIRRSVERVETAGFIDPMPRLIVAPPPILTQGRIHLGPVRQMPPLIRPR